MIQQIQRQFVRTSRPLYGHLVHLLESAIARGDLPSGSRLPPERELAQSAADQPDDRGRGVPGARVARAAARVRGTRHVRLRRARTGRDAVCLARQDRGCGAAIERLHAARRDPPFVRRSAAVARRGRTGDRLLPDGGVSAGGRSGVPPRWPGGVASRADRGSAGASGSDRRAVQGAG